MVSAYAPCPACAVTSVSEDLFYGQSPTMVAVRATVERVASAKLPVLLRGESGTGKDVLARIIHQTSIWSAGPFVKINCPAMPEPLLETDLFGYERSPLDSRLGWVELADRGTLFLDEVGELALPMQSKLLRLIQDGVFTRIGGKEERPVQVRTISATNRDLEHQVASGTFRRDLLHRINVVTITLPPLRKRLGDIPTLAEYFLNKYSHQYQRVAQPLTRNGLSVLQRYQWPGNIRELENCMRRCILLDSEQVFTELARAIEDGPDLDRSVNSQSDLKTLTRSAIREVERQAILTALHANKWNRKAAARDLNISYRALFYKMEQAGIRPKRRPD